MAGALSLLAGTGAAATGTTLPETGPVLAVAMAARPFTLDPHATPYRSNMVVAEHLYEMLLGNEDGRLVPRLAVRWQASGPGRWDITLRPGARFHDGSPLGARDVVYSLCRMAAVPQAGKLVAGLAGAEALPDGRVRLTEAGDGGFGAAAMSLVAVMKAPPGGGRFTPPDCGGPPTFIGSGPFQLAEGKTGDTRLVLRARDADGEGAPPWARVELLAVPGETERARLLREGRVDVAENLQPDSLHFLSEQPELRIVATPTDLTVVLAVSMARRVMGADGQVADNPFCDPRRREALRHLVDRQAIAARVFRGFAEPASQLVQRGMRGFQPDMGVVPANPARARALLAEVGAAPPMPLAVPEMSTTQVHRVAAQLWGAAQAASLPLVRGTTPHPGPVGVDGQPPPALAITSWSNIPRSLHTLGGNLLNQIPATGEACPDADAARERLRALLATIPSATGTEPGERDPGEGPLRELALTLDRLAYHVPLVHLKSAVGLRPGLDYAPGLGVAAYGRRVRQTSPPPVFP